MFKVKTSFNIKDEFTVKSKSPSLQAMLQTIQKTPIRTNINLKRLEQSARYSRYILLHFLIT
jgi:hypothetical protein